MNFWSDPFGVFKKHVGGLFNSVENDTTTTEPMAASHNMNPMSFDISAKPLIDPPIVEFIPDNFSNEPPPAEVQNLLNTVLNSLVNTNDEDMAPNYNDKSVGLTTMDIPDKDGHMLVKIIEDMTGKTVEVIHEASTKVISENPIEASFTTIKTMSEALSSSENSAGSQILYESGTQSGDSTSYVDVNLIIALILLILMTMSICIIVWCRKNKLKSVKRNAGKYPIAKKHNQKLSNAEKLKVVP